MTLKTRVLNIFRKISQIPAIETILAKRIHNGSRLSRKLIASHRMYPHGSFRDCTRQNLHFHLDISEYMEYAIYFDIKDGIDFDRRVLYSLVKNNSVCFDIGANIGETTLNFARLAREGKVYSFEPVPFLFERLQTNVSFNNFPNIFLNNLALSDKKEQLFFESSKNHNSSGISLQKHPTSRSQAVNSTTIDSFVEENNITHIDFMKIDVEGFESLVIKGGMRTLKKFMPVIFMEVDHHNLSKNNSSEKELLMQMHSLGYSLFRIEGIQKIKIHQSEYTGLHYDVLCIMEE
jgi:FkbM family methyltransferase